jgi:hypothetical protein
MSEGTGFQRSRRAGGGSSSKIGKSAFGGKADIRRQDRGRYGRPWRRTSCMGRDKIRADFSERSAVRFGKS